MGSDGDFKPHMPDDFGGLIVGHGKHHSSGSILTLELKCVGPLLVVDVKNSLPRIS